MTSTPFHQPAARGRVARLAPGPRVLAGIAFASVGLLGIFIGVAADRWLLADRTVQGVNSIGWRGRSRPWSFADGMTTLSGSVPTAGGRRESQRQFLLDRLSRELGLSPTQRTRVDSVLVRRLAVLRAVREQMRPQMERQLDSARQDLQQILTPEQRLRFQTMNLRHHGTLGAP